MGKQKIWIAPEHARMAQDMKRDYPRDDWGIRLPGSEKELVVDNHPTIMVEEKRKYQIRRPKKRLRIYRRSTYLSEDAGYDSTTKRWSYIP